MIRNMLTKHKKKFKEVNQSADTIKVIGYKVKNVFKGTITVVKKTVIGIHNLIAADSFLIFLVILILFIAIFFNIIL